MTDSSPVRCRDVRDGTTLVAQIYDLNCKGDIIFPTSGDAEMQCGFGHIGTHKVIPAHIHNRRHRDVYNTSEFIFVAEGRMDVVFYNDQGQVMAEHAVKSGMALLQFCGGHGITIAAGTTYIEVKQGPYFGNQQDKTLIGGS